MSEEEKKGLEPENKAEPGTNNAEANQQTKAKDEDADRAAKAEAAAKAKAAAAAKAKAAALAKAKEGEAKEAEPPKPSPNQPILDEIVKIITDRLGADVLENSYINRLSKDVPTIIVKKDRWLEVARLLKEDEKLAFDYLSNLLGVDYETYMESVYYFFSFKYKRMLCVKLKDENRDNPVFASITGIWPGADWQEREQYDLLGIKYEGHPNLRRIMLSDDWVGHPLRKDYVQYDEEV